MSLLGFGQPRTGIFQMAYVVEDIEAGMQRWIEQLGVGPWYLLEHFTGERATYRGAPAEADVALAMAYAGHMLVELIAPNDDKPSVYRPGDPAARLRLPSLRRRQPRLRRRRRAPPRAGP